MYLIFLRMLNKFLSGVMCFETPTSILAFGGKYLQKDVTSLFSTFSSVYKVSTYQFGTFIEWDKNFILLWQLLTVTLLSADEFFEALPKVIL